MTHEQLHHKRKEMNNTKSNVEFEYNKYLDFCQQNNITQKPAYGNWEEHLRQESLRINKNNKEK